MEYLWPTSARSHGRVEGIKEKRKKTKELRIQNRRRVRGSWDKMRVNGEVSIEKAELSGHLFWDVFLKGKIRLKRTIRNEIRGCRHLD